MESRSDAETALLPLAGLSGRGLPDSRGEHLRILAGQPFLDAAATASLRMASRISHAPDLRKTTGLSGILGRVGGSGSPGKNPEAAAATSLRRGDAETSSAASGRRSVPRPVLSAQASM